MFLLLIKSYKMISRFISKLAIKVLDINILDSKLVSKILIKTNVEYKVVSS